jgi:hypothetical protein
MTELILRRFREEDSMSFFLDYLENYNMEATQKSLILMISN